MLADLDLHVSQHNHGTLESRDLAHIFKYTQINNFFVNSEAEHR